MTRWSDVPGWFNAMDLYDEVALTTPPYSSVVEVGVCYGRSLLYLAQRIKETGKQIQVVAVDRWDPYPEHDFIYNHESKTRNESEQRAYEYSQLFGGGTWLPFLSAVADSGLSDIIRIVRADSVDASRLFAEKPPHFVFIDAAHDYDNVKRDINAWWATGPEWMAGDDYNPGSEVDYPGVWKAVHEKFGAQNVGQRQHTSWVVRRSQIDNQQPGSIVRESMRPWDQRSDRGR